jgi:hypothetical protein
MQFVNDAEPLSPAPYAAIPPPITRPVFVQFVNDTIPLFPGR